MADERRIGEMAKELKELAKIVRNILESRTDIQYIPDLAFPIAKELLKHYQPKISEGSVVLTKEEQDKILQATEYRINQLRIQIAVKENDIGKLESEIDDLKHELKQAHKEMAKKYNDKLVEIIQHLFDIGQIDFKAKIEFLKENEKILNQFGVEIKE